MWNCRARSNKSLISFQYLWHFYKNLCNEFVTLETWHLEDEFVFFWKEWILFLGKCLFNKMVHSYMLRVLVWTFSIIKYLAALLWSIWSSGLGHHNLLTLEFVVILVASILRMGSISIILKGSLIWKVKCVVTENRPTVRSTEIFVMDNKKVSFV